MASAKKKTSKKVSKKSPANPPAASNENAEAAEAAEATEQSPPEAVESESKADEAPPVDPAASEDGDDEADASGDTSEGDTEEGSEELDDVDDLDPQKLYPEIYSSPKGFETKFPDMEQADYAPEIKKLRAAAAQMIEEAEALEEDYRLRFPAQRALKPEHQNAINAAHAKRMRKKARAEKSKSVKELIAAGVDPKLAPALIGGSKLDRVLLQRGKDPSLKRKPVPPKNPRG